MIENQVTGCLLALSAFPFTEVYHETLKRANTILPYRIVSKNPVLISESGRFPTMLSSNDAESKAAMARVAVGLAPEGITMKKATYHFVA